MSEAREADKAQEKAVCPCGADAITTVHLAGAVTKCDQGFEHQEQIEVPLCGAHDVARLDGRIDGRMLLAAAKMKDQAIASMLLEHDPEPRLMVRHVRGHDKSTVVAYEIQPLAAPTEEAK
jgi:hypothetical protein